MLAAAGRDNRSLSAQWGGVPVAKLEEPEETIKRNDNGAEMELDLRRTEITGARLVHLKGLTNLEVLTLFKTKVTDAGAAELRKVQPNCGISN